jgi:hypothetical protein
MHFIVILIQSLPLLCLKYCNKISISIFSFKVNPQAAQPLSGLYILNIYTEYLTVIIFNNEIIQKILTIYVKIYLTC